MDHLHIEALLPPLGAALSGHLFTGDCFTDFLLIHGFFFCSKKAHFVHSQVHLAITGESFAHSLQSHVDMHSI